MALEDTISRIQGKLRQGRFPNEASVSNGAVLPILHALGWPVFDTSVVSPEYTLEGRRVDFALCHSSGRPVVFLEVKRVGYSQSGERQLFEYAFHKGVPLAVLADGQEWHFYLPAEQGDYQDRRVYKLDLLERDVTECCYRLKRYLSNGDVIDGAALRNARSDYEDITRQRQIEQTFPLAWTKLLEDADESLVEALAEKVEDLCGYKPYPDTCVEYLSTMVSPTAGVQASQPVPPDAPRSISHSAQFSPAPSIPTQSLNQIGFVLQGQQHSHGIGSAIEVMRSLFDILANSDPTFPERFASRKHGRRRRYLAQDKYELYPDRPDLCDRSSYELKCGGWFISTNYNKGSIDKIIRLACEVADFRFGRDLVVNLG